MQIIAKVADIEISQKDVERECAKLKSANEGYSHSLAMQHLIDRCLLLIKARQSGIEISNEEYDDAVLELIEVDEPFGLTSSDLQALTAVDLEKLLRRHLIIKKYISTLCPQQEHLSESALQELYKEKKELFQIPAMVHCYHILVKGQEPDSKAKADKIRAAIHSAEDFYHYSRSSSDCPSFATCGDLGWISPGKLIKEMEDVAFGMKPGEISDVFSTIYGYHILMVHDYKPPQPLALEKIEGSFMARLEQLEKEFFLTRHVMELRNEYADSIVIFQNSHPQRACTEE